MFRGRPVTQRFRALDMLGILDGDIVRRRTPTLRDKVVLGGIDSNLVQPGIELAFATKRTDGPVGSDECFLGNILALGPVADVARDQRHDLVLILAHKQVIGAGIALLDAFNQHAIRFCFAHQGLLPAVSSAPWGAVMLVHAAQCRNTVEYRKEAPDRASRGRRCVDEQGQVMLRMSPTEQERIAWRISDVAPLHDRIRATRTRSIPVTKPHGGEMQEGELLAAVDLGSNSFHMVVARYEHGVPRVIDRLRETTRMAAGLDPGGSLEPAQRQRALDCLARFGQRLAGVSTRHVRAVGTNTLRQLAHPQEFLRPAERVLGHPIEVVSGREEARLIFLGVAHGLPLSRQRRLVIDIGGGSTEFIIGHQLDPLHAESIQVGCVASSLRFFPGGKITRKRWQHAREEIGVLLQQFAMDFREAGWQECFGASGTVKAIEAVVAGLGLSEHGITLPALAALRELLLEAGNTAKLSLTGLSEERAPVFPGGVVILEAAFEHLALERMQTVDVAMREGILWDMVGRAEGSDPRRASIQALARRYGVDEAQAARVDATAQALLQAVGPDWVPQDEAAEWLDWAARVHEIGLAIAHSQHHRHAGYILRHADLPGFSRDEQQLLACIVEAHRRKPDKAAFNALPPRFRVFARRITALLRLAVLLRRARRSEPIPALELQVVGERLQLSLPAGWLHAHPLTITDLDLERALLAELGLKLELERT